MQTQGLLGLQAADEAIADGQPVQAGDEKLAGQQAALVNERLIRLARGALIAACGEGTTGISCSAALPGGLPTQEASWPPQSSQSTRRTPQPCPDFLSGPGKLLPLLRPQSSPL